MTTITFAKSEFPSLALGEYTSKWNAVALDDLSSAEQEIMSVFFAYALNGADFDTSDVLLVKSGNGGVLDEVYGPSVYNLDGELIIKCGSNTIPLTVVKELNPIRAGLLAGNFSFDNPKEKTYKDDDGEEQTAQLYRGTLDLIVQDSDSDIEYRINVLLNYRKGATPAMVNKAIAAGKPIAQYFQDAPVKGQGGGSGNTINMAELGTGEFPVESVRNVTTRNGQSYVLQLKDGREVWSRGNVQTVLDDPRMNQTIQDALSNGKPLTLAITAIKPTTNGNRVECALRMRSPVASQPKPKQPVGAGVGTTDEDIPF